MNVSLLSYTPNPEIVVACAAKECYSKSDPDRLMDNMTQKTAGEFLDRLSNLGHSAPTEMAVFTFSISGVSRVLLAQLSRHRIASFAVRSQRYVNMDEAGFVEPESIRNDEEAHKIFNQAVTSCKAYYKLICNSLCESYVNSGMELNKAKKKAQEDARYVLPEATQTSLVLTMNARELNHFFTLRCCERAQDEIRELANRMLILVYDVAPHLFKNAGPGCVATGHCTEGNMSCGKATEVIDKYHKLKDSLNHVSLQEYLDNASKNWNELTETQKDTICRSIAGNKS